MGIKKKHDKGEQDWNSEKSTGQKKSEEISAQQTRSFALLRGLPHPLVSLHHLIFHLLHHQHVAQPFPLYCLCFSSGFPFAIQ